MNFKDNELLTPLFGDSEIKYLHMKKIHLFSYFCILFLLSCINKDTQNKVIIIHDFPKEGSLTAEIKDIPPVAMTPSYIFTSGNYLVLYNNKKDTLFDIFSIPELKLLHSSGTKGEGPQDFYQLERRMFLPTKKGFKVFSQPDKKIKEVWITDSTLWIDNEQSKKFEIDQIPVNGVIALNDTSIIYWGNIDSDAEYVSHGIISGAKTFCSYPKWDKKNRPDAPIFKYVKNSILNKDHSRFISFYGYFKQFRIYNTDGKLLKDVAVQHPPYENTIKEKAEERIIYYHIPPQTYEDYIYVMCKNATRSEEKIQELQVWNWEGEPIARYNMDRKLTIFTISPENKKIYAIDGENEDKIYVYDLPLP